MNRRFMRWRFALLLAACAMLAVALTTGCDTRKEAGPQYKGVAAHAPACAAPVKIALLGDKTSSIELARTPQIRAEDLNPLVDLISRCGGEVALGFVTD